MENIVDLGSGVFSFVKYINRYIIMPVFDFFAKIHQKLWMGNCSADHFYSVGNFALNLYQLFKWCKNESAASRT